MAVSFADGFESGDTSAWSSVAGTPTVQSSVVQEGVFALLTTAGESVTHTITAGNRVVVLRWWFRTSADPSGARAIIGGLDVGDVITAQIKLTGVISMYEDSITELDTGPDLAAGSWYPIDMRLNTSANPWVLSWIVNGADQGNTNIAHSAADIVGFTIGNSGAGVTNTYVDHAQLSLVSGDYPLTDAREVTYGANVGENFAGTGARTFGTGE